MSAEAGAVALLKWVFGGLATVLFASLGWAVNKHSAKLDDVDKAVGDIKVDLAKNYHSKEEVERQVALMMAPTNERLDILVSTMTQAVDELRKLNERVIRVETKQR